MARKKLSHNLLSQLRGPQRWSEPNARKIISELELSGSSVLAFADEHELSPSRLYYWRNRLDEPDPAQEVGLSFAPVVVTGLGRKPALAIRVGALELEVFEPAEIEPSWLGRVCAAAMKEGE